MNSKTIQSLSLTSLDPIGGFPFRLFKQDIEFCIFNDAELIFEEDFVKCVLYSGILDLSKISSNSLNSALEFNFKYNNLDFDLEPKEKSLLVHSIVDVSYGKIPGNRTGIVKLECIARET